MGLVNIINLTPHTVTVCGAGKEVLASFPTSGSIARVVMDTKVMSTALGFPVTQTVFGAVEGLPSESADTVYIVSAMVKNALPGRTDLLVPVGRVVDDNGAIIGCTSLGM